MGEGIFTGLDFADEGFEGFVGALGRFRFPRHLEDVADEVGGAALGEGLELTLDRCLVPDDRDLCRAFHALDVQDAAIVDQLAVAGVGLGSRPAPALSSSVAAVGRPTVTLGAALPLLPADRLIRGVMCVSMVRGPAIQVTVPSASCPARFSIWGASAETRMGQAGRSK